MSDGAGRRQAQAWIACSGMLRLCPRRFQTVMEHHVDQDDHDHEHRTTTTTTTESFRDSGARRVCFPRGGLSPKYRRDSEFWRPKHVPKTAHVVVNLQCWPGLLETRVHRDPVKMIGRERRLCTAPQQGPRLRVFVPRAPRGHPNLFS